MSEGIAFHAIAWHAPILVSRGSRLWRMRDWYRTGRGEKDISDFTWGYYGDGPHAVAYSMLYEAFGKSIAEEYAAKLMDEFVARCGMDGGFTLRGDDLCEMLGLKLKGKKRR
jgi:hypothetical protein